MRDGTGAGEHEHMIIEDLAVAPPNEATGSLRKSGTRC